MPLSSDELNKAQELSDTLKTWFTPEFSNILAKRLLKYDSDVQKVISYEFLPGSTYGTVEYSDSDGDVHLWNINPNPTQ